MLSRKTNSFYGENELLEKRESVNVITRPKPDPPEMTLERVNVCLSQTV